MKTLRDHVIELVTNTPEATLPLILAAFKQVAEPVRDLQRVAPDQQYSRRQDKSQGPVAFIKERYGHLLDGDFGRPELRKIDPTLMRALDHLEQMRGERVPLSELNLPTIMQRNDELIAASMTSGTAIVRRGVARLKCQRKRQNYGKTPG